MDLTNKNIIIDRVGINNLEKTTMVTIKIYSVLPNGIKKLDDTYEMNIEDTFQGDQDPALMAAILEKLQELP